jgi:integrase
MRTINKGKTPRETSKQRLASSCSTRDAARPSAAKIISTALQADNARSGVHKVSGATGLYLKVGETGAGSYFWRFRLGDKRREMGLGSRAKIKLSEARDAARALAVKQKEGIDPLEQRRRERAENLARSRATPPPTFEQMTADYLKAHCGDWKHKYARAVWLNPLVKFAFPVIGRLALDEIEIGHITAIMRRAESAGAPMTGRRVRAQIARVLNRAIGLRGKVVGNPADAKLHPSPRKGERPHYRAVDLNDAPKIFQALKARAEANSAFAAWRFMVLTAARPSEALNSKWSEIDLAKRLWTLSPERMKSSKQHIVPLSAAALEVLDRQARVRTGDAVFPGGSSSPLSYNSFATAPMGAGIDAACPHGWRSVFRDWAGDPLDGSPFCVIQYRRTPSMLISGRIAPAGAPIVPLIAAPGDLE